MTKKNSFSKKARMRYRPWYWPFWMLSRLTHPLSPGLWLVNVLHQRVLRINGEIPWMVHFTSTVFGKVSIGRNVEKYFAVSGGCYIQGINGIEIGDDTMIAPGVKIISANHSICNFATWETCDPIRIDKRCWIGAGAIILPGVQLGDEAIIGAGSVVTKNVPSRSIMVGNPARVLKSE